MLFTNVEQTQGETDKETESKHAKKSIKKANGKTCAVQSK